MQHLLLNFLAPKQLRHASVELKKLALEMHCTALCMFEDHSLWPVVCTKLLVGIHSMEKLLSLHMESIEDLKKMQHLSRLVSLHAFGALFEIRFSRHNVIRARAAVHLIICLPTRISPLRYAPSSAATRPPLRRPTRNPPWGYAKLLLTPPLSRHRRR